MTAEYRVGDVFDRLAELEDGSVDLIITSPPFLALRSYLPADHPDKGKEIGSESTPAEFIGVLLRLSAEWRRVLAPHGSLCVELGDTYAGSGGAGGDYNEHGIRAGQPRWDGSVRLGHGVYVEGKGRLQDGDGWPLAKSKTLIPELYRLALAYGIHPLTGQPSPAGKWLVRNVVTWCRPNPPVGALGDKWRPATSDVVVACTSPKRYWDDLATRRPHVVDPLALSDASGKNPKATRVGLSSGNWKTKGHEAGAPLLDFWEIPPGGYPGSHYAVYPPALVEPLVKAMGPQRVCRECGEPSRRVVSEAEYVNSKTGKPVTTLHFDGKRRQDGENHWDTAGQGDRAATRQVETLGWTDCGHDNYRPGLVLDPFAGSGTTLAVATGHGLDAVGFDLDERNASLALDRVGPLLLEVVA